MGREIKFRAWDKKEKFMYLPNDLESLNRDGDYILMQIFDGALWNKKDFNSHYFALNLILMQFTGLHDMNGKEIYEGDILKNHWNNCDGEDIGSVWVVKFGEHSTSEDYYASQAYGFYAESGNEEHSLHDLPCNESIRLPNERDVGIEIIGDIYTTPELLEGSQDG